MGQTNGWMDCFKMKYMEDLMLIYSFLSITLHKGGKFTINSAKRCLFRLAKLQPGECLFWYLVESYFFLHTPSFREPSFYSVWNCTSSLLFFLIFQFLFTKILSSDLFLKKTIQASLYLICVINRLHGWATCKWYIKAVYRSLLPTKVWLPWVLGNAHFVFCWMML